MFVLNNLTTSGNQTTTVILADGTSATLTFIYRAAVQRWTVDVTYKSFIEKGRGLSSHPNLLRIWRNVIQFGLRVSTADGTDPFLADDLASGRVTITVLDGTAGQTDLIDVEAANFQ